MSKVLVIDDDSILVETLALLLQAQGHLVVTAPGGQEGLALCDAQCPDIVFTDILMPGCDGIEVIRAIRKQQQQTKIVAMSAGGVLYKQDILRLAHRMGADQVLAKPFSADEVFATLAKLLGDTDISECKETPTGRSSRSAA